MQLLKDYAALIGTIIGVLSGMVTLYAKYLDLRKKNGGKKEEDESEVAESPAPATPRLTRPAAIRPVRLEVMDEPPPAPRVVTQIPLALVRELVKWPAIAMMLAGGLGLVMNILVAGYGYVDAFVTPLSDDTKALVAAGKSPDTTTAALTIVATLGISVASLAAIWAGFNMLRLRSYWLSVAGSIMVMPGACLCCFAGFPVGIWSMTVLFRPEVQAAFH